MNILNHEATARCGRYLVTVDQVKISDWKGWLVRGKRIFPGQTQDNIWKTFFTVDDALNFLQTRVRYA